MSDGDEVQAGEVIGPPGRNGDHGHDGAPGAVGVGIAGAEIRDGELHLTYSDGRAEAVGRVVGRDGAPGKTGRQGPPGEAGAPGRNGADGSTVLLSEAVSANLAADDLPRLYRRQLTIDGATVEILTLG